MKKKCDPLDTGIYTAGISDYFGERQKRWDTYYHRICRAVASKSPCLSRQIGAILVKENVVVATGYNGPPRGYPHCKPVDHGLCPRKAKGYASGEGLLECPAVHAEVNCIISAARIGTSVSGSTLYMNCIIPCKDCMSLLINAGVREVVVEDIIAYHEMSLPMAESANIKIRRFKL